MKSQSVLPQLFSIAFLIGYGSCQLVQPGQQDRSKGTYLGNFNTLAHQVSGAVWALDDEWIHIEEFTYDGKGPDAFFWVGYNGSQPSPYGHLVPFPFNATEEKDVVLPAFYGTNVLFRLPKNLKVSDLRWISVWCRRFTVDFGSLKVPSSLVLPKKRKLSELSRLAHQVRSGNVTILDAKTLYIPNLHYDGTAPDAYFWVGRGKPDRTGRKIPNEKQSLEVLGHYNGVDIELVLPDNLTVYDIDYLSIWCVAYRHDFGHVLIPPANELYVPPAMGQTNVKAGATALDPSSKDQYLTPDERQFTNCKKLGNPKFTVEWEAKQNSVEIRLTAAIDDFQYMAFGLSPRNGKPVMENSDVVVTYYDSTDGSYHAVDYSITDKAPCEGLFGVCPDERIGHRNDASIINGERRDGLTSITYSRPYETGDRHDLRISNEPQTIVAAIGSLDQNNMAKYHNTFHTRDNILIDLRNGLTNDCDPVAPTASQTPTIKPWPPSVIQGVDKFIVNLGPTGGDRGYKAITNTTSWGIAWWVNGLLIPEIYVERGKTYDFVIEGGDNHANSADFHPFYITDNMHGGYHQKTTEEQAKERIFGGVEKTKQGMPKPTALGRACRYKHNGVDQWKESETFSEYFETLYRECESGKPGHLTWTVPLDAPDLLYYQCYSHQNLGWKIKVNDQGFTFPSGRFSGAPHLPKASLLAGILAITLPLLLR